MSCIELAPLQSNLEPTQICWTANTHRACNDIRLKYTIPFDGNLGTLSSFTSQTRGVYFPTDKLYRKVKEYQRIVQVQYFNFWIQFFSLSLSWYMLCRPPYLQTTSAFYTYSTIKSKAMPSITCLVFASATVTTATRELKTKRQSGLCRREKKTEKFITHIFKTVLSNYFWVSSMWYFSFWHVASMSRIRL